MFRLSAALLALAFAAAAPARAECLLAKMPMAVTMVGSKPSVEVRLNDHPVRLEVDSGSFFSTLSAAAAAQLGVHTRPAPFNFYVTGVGGQENRVDLAKVKFGVGKTDVPQMDFVVLPGLQGDLGIVGLLGRNILAHWDVDYDFAHGELALVQPRACGGKVLAYWDPAADVLPMTGANDSPVHPATAWVKINGKEIKALFDTGASSTGLTMTGARKVGLDVHGPKAIPAGSTHGIGQRTSASWLVPVDEVLIGGEKIKNTKVRVSDYTATDHDMLIGADFFLSHHVYVANSQQKIYFTYNGGPVFDLTVKAGAAPPPEPAPTWIVQAAQPPTSMSAAAATAGAAPAADEPKDADGYSRRGQAFAARRDEAHALADLTRAVELDPQNARYLRERAQLRLQTRQPFLAMQDLDAALKLAPDDAETLVMRARLRAAGRDRAGEQADLEAADRAAAKQADVRLALGVMYSGLDQQDRAIAQFDQWLSFHAGDSREATALNGRCWARALAGRELDQALRDCDGALRLQPKQAAYFDSRALVRFKRGELDRARGDYDAAVALAPKQPLALYGRGVVRTRQGDAVGGQADIAAATAINAQVGEQARRAGLTS